MGFIKTKSLKDVKPAIAVATTSINLTSTYSLHGLDIEIEVLSGSIWIKNASVVTALTGNKLSSASIELVADDDLSIISDATGATVQLWIYK